MFDYLIIGAGISGVTFARLLQLSGNTNFKIVEAQDQPGGLCRTKQIGDYVLDTGGGHFLCTRYQEVYDFIFSHIAKDEFNFFPRVSKIRVENCEVDYPLENNIWQLPDEIKARFLASIFNNGEAKGDPVPDNFCDWVTWRLGSEIAQSYMIPYNKKIWGIPLNEMDTDWLHKLPRLNSKEILDSCTSGKPYEGRMPSHEGFYYPKRSGFQIIFDAIYAALPEQSVALSEPAFRLEKREGCWLVNDSYRAKTVINTAPWSALAKAIDFPAGVAAGLKQLRHNELIVSLYKQEYSTKAHWIYEPSLEKNHHREFMIHNFAPDTPPDGLYTETNILRWEPNPAAIYEHKNDFAYPIPSIGRAVAIKNILEWGSSAGLHGLGRWGQWDYLNADVCIKEAMNLFQCLAQK